MNNEELKKKIAQIIADYFCSQRNEHKNLWGDNRLCYSKMNFAECEWVTECTDALISAGIGDLKEHRIFAGKDGSIKQLYSGEEVEKMAKEREEYKHRAARAERALENACVVILSSRNGDQPRRLRAYYKAYLDAAEKELAEEGKDENY